MTALPRADLPYAASRAPRGDALAPLLDAVRAAGEIALAAFRPGAPTTARVSWKEGNSPVTEADHAVDALLRARLSAAFPDAGWLSEETADDPVRLTRRRTLIVDPIDGTRGFMTGDDRFCVCAALAEEGRPVAGVVHAPARGETFAAAQA
jgi:myo-inositol-1(or 4)-monophosphatase